MELLDFFSKLLLLLLLFSGRSDFNQLILASVVDIYIYAGLYSTSSLLLLLLLSQSYAWRCIKIFIFNIFWSFFSIFVWNMNYYIMMIIIISSSSMIIQCLSLQADNVAEGWTGWVNEWVSVKESCRITIR